MANKISYKRRKAITTSTSSETSVPASAKVIASNVDLLSEILLRLPPKSLIRFKSVSRNWLHLISDSHFASNHSRRNRNLSISGLFYHHSWPTNEQPNSVSLVGQSSLPTLAFIESPATIRIKSSCNGLLLCEIYRDVSQRKRVCYIVCNPTTQKFTPLLDHGGNPSPACLAFDPSQSPHYKVVLLHYIPSPQFAIYSSESKSWKRITVDALPVTYLNGVFWNGAIHWLTDNYLVRFDVGSDEQIQIPNPIAPKILSLAKTRYFGECDGHLLLIQMRLRSAMGFRILQMESDSFCWIVKCRVNLRPLISVFPDIDDTSKDYKFHVLCVVKEVNENEFGLVLATAGKIICYNLNCKALKVLRDDFSEVDFYGLYFKKYPYNCTYQFVESLSPV
ncbi:hypothetical protein TEA_028842 [Camellia sinensis var. sinensis]|uniref:F-box domain-containing protein n=1 Tax=Camellia sinensis var. sinensis TaxID=542762 RepID=A0A4S4EQS6_CAMSN|nr:hypothetical protein TEA_028842 [Camellia sinensis var. sinensis]